MSTASAAHELAFRIDRAIGVSVAGGTGLQNREEVAEGIRMLVAAILEDVGQAVTPGAEASLSKLRFITAMAERDFNVRMDDNGDFVNESTNAMFVGWEAAHGR